MRSEELTNLIDELEKAVTAQRMFATTTEEWEAYARYQEALKREIERVKDLVHAN